MRILCPGRQGSNQQAGEPAGLLRGGGPGSAAVFTRGQVVCEVRRRRASSQQGRSAVLVVQTVKNFFTGHSIPSRRRRNLRRARRRCDLTVFSGSPISLAI